MKSLQLWRWWWALLWCVWCVHLSAARATAHGQISGDPAPGRSPGPPHSANVDGRISSDFTDRSQAINRSIASAPANATSLFATNVTANATSSPLTSSSASPSVSSTASFVDNETIERPPPASVQTSAAAADNDDTDDADAANDADCERVAERMYLRAQGAIRTAADAAGLRLLVTHDVFDVGHGLVQQIVYTVRLLYTPAAGIRDFYVAADAGRFFEPAEIDEVLRLSQPQQQPSSASSASSASAAQSSWWHCARCSCANVWSDEAAALAERRTAAQSVRIGSSISSSRNGRSGADLSAEWSIKWFVNMPDRQNKTVKFRLMFRKVTSSAVFETVYTHHLLEDCNLTLLHPSASLDYTHMPLYNNYENCTVFFPSRRPHDFQHTHNLNMTSSTATSPSASPTSSSSSSFFATNESDATASSSSNTIDASASADAGGDDATSTTVASGGLIVQLTRLNVPCKPAKAGGAYLAFSTTTNTITTTLHNHTAPSATAPSQTPTQNIPSSYRDHVCGKLEDLPASERTRYFPLGQQTGLRLVRHPTFRLRYDLVDTCYNVSFRGQNGSYFVRPRDTINCTFTVHLPYGNRIRLRMLENGIEEDDAAATAAEERWAQGGQDEVEELLEFSSGAHFRSPYRDNYYERDAADELPADIEDDDEEGGGCSQGVYLQLIDPLSAFRWSDCIRIAAPTRRLVIVSTGNRLVIRVRQHHRYRQRRPDVVATKATTTTTTTTASSTAASTSASSSPSLYFAYDAVPDARIVGTCPFGWMAMQQLCITAVEKARTWLAAELECKARNGNLAVIRDEREQRQIDVMLLAGATATSASAAPAYWVGASDRAVEGEFRWSSGYPFGYSNWFPGWPEYNHYNKQPNDDSLSGQDCVEIRRYFQAPGGTFASAASFSASSSSSATSAGSVPLSASVPAPSLRHDSFMWNDRDCNASNYFLCERPQSVDMLASLASPFDAPSLGTAADGNAASTFAGATIAEQAPGLLAAHWPGIASACNQTVRLSRARQRAHVSSPGNPYDYPDNVNCFTVVEAPAGYSVVLEFEEFVLEPEPECTYDFLEIVDPFSKASSTADSIEAQLQQQHSAEHWQRTNDVFPEETSAHSPLRSLYMKYMTHQQHRIERSLPFRQAAKGSIVAHSSSLNNTNSDATDNGTAYEQFMRAYEAMGQRSATVLRIPAQAGAIAAADFAATKQRPHRVCGDWNAKLKLLRYTSAGRLLGLRFSSDYSHHRSGYKARVVLKNASSECADERLIPFGGSCYLFVSYPEVDWLTARSVCGGIGASLASIRTVDEQRFIVDNIRHQMDFTTHTVYWLGGEQRHLNRSRPMAAADAFRWTDGQNMSYVGWLPGDEIVASGAGATRNGSAQSLCIALRWKLSPTPMLPSSIYWSAERCSKYGGYVCKSPPASRKAYSARNKDRTASDATAFVEDAVTIAANIETSDQPPPSSLIQSSTTRHRLLENRTIDAREGRLTSPGYPNTYPPDTDYWIRVRGPPNTRLIVQFQSIDLEPQEECLYDYVSVQDARNNDADASSSGSMQSPDDALNTGEYTTADLTAKRWYRNDLQRIGRLKRALPGEYGRNAATSALLLQHEIGVLQRFRDSMLQTTTSLLANGQRARRRRRALQIGTEAPQHTTTTADLLYTASGSQAESAVAGQPSFAPYVRWCGTHSANMTRFDYVASANAALLHFHSDYSVGAMGFAARWSSVDVTGCPAQTLTAHEGHLESPNWPHFMLNGLQCAFEIYAGRGRRVWLEFEAFEVLQDGLVEVDVGDGGGMVVVPYRQQFADGDELRRQHRQQEQKHLNDGIYVSRENRLVVRLRTGAMPRGRGFRAVYRSVSVIAETHRIALPETAYGHLYHLNHPLAMPEHVNFTQHLVAPVGYVVFLEFFGVRFSDQPCSHIGGIPDDGNNNATSSSSSDSVGSLEVFDRYADVNGTAWTLCSSASTAAATFAPVHITSYLNTLHVRQLSGSGRSAVRLNASVRVIADLQYKRKLAAGGDTVESCLPNPCQSGGRCVTTTTTTTASQKKQQLQQTHRCVCVGHFTGRFCALTACEVAPCMYGKCQLTATGFKCACQEGYVGRTCDRKQPPCAQNPCEGRGECFNRPSGYFCRCHAWWEGQRCEKRMQNIPYKPLSDRMLQEPFWLGLITVFVVLAFIGLVWCAKRHFPEKIEKLLTEEAERNRPPGMLGGPHHHHHHQSLREQLQFTTTTATSSGSHSNVTTPGAARTIFSRFGIRKPSIVSVSSQPQPLLTTTNAIGGSATGSNAIGSEDGGHCGGSSAAATARTFSLDDLLRPPPRRTPSPRKKRNNSTPSKPNSCNAAEKKQILQQLLGPAGGMEKIQLNELISIGSGNGRNGNGGGSIRETALSEGPEILELANDAKLEKKVTFARLLNKVSAEMSSSSDTTSTTPRVPSAHHTHHNAGLLSANAASPSLSSQHHRRTSSMPPSPCGLDGVVRLDSGIRSTASTQSSDSMSSTELMLMPTSTVIVDQHQQPSSAGQSSSAQRCSSVASSAASLPIAPSSSTQSSAAAAQRNLRPKVCSADSLLTMFRNFTAGRNALANGSAAAAASSERSALSPSSSMATSSASPHDELLGIGGGANGGGGGGGGDDDSSTSSLHTPVSFNSLSNGIHFEVSAVELLRAAECAEAAEAAAATLTAAADAAAQRNEQQHSATVHQQNYNPHYAGTNGNNVGGNYLLTASGLQLDLPANINQCLSPIREMPTPMPSPAPTPVMMRQHSFGMRFGARNQDDNEADEQLQIERSHVGITFKSFITKQPSLDAGGASQSTASGSESLSTDQSLAATNGKVVEPTLCVPSIHISLDADLSADADKRTQRSPAVRPTQLIIPMLVVEQSSPVAERLPVMFLGSPPPQRQSVGETNFYTGNGSRSRSLKSMEKPSSLDLLCMPPTITVTPNPPSRNQHHHHHHHQHNANDTTTTISDSSDADLNHAGYHAGGSSAGATGNSASGHSSGGGGGTRQLHLLKVPTIGMTYLSPFSMCTRGDRVISEGNLSSSGYSSMASPGPSRCGSNNPLLPPGEDGGQSPGSGGGGAGRQASGSIAASAAASTAPNDVAIAFTVPVPSHQQAASTTAGRVGTAIGGACGGRGASSALASSASVSGMPLQMPLRLPHQQRPASQQQQQHPEGVGGSGLLMAQLGPNGKLQHLARRARMRSDSETMSDEMMVLESNDEGIEIDQANGSGGAEETPERGDGGGLMVEKLTQPDAVRNVPTAAVASESGAAGLTASCIAESSGIVLAVPLLAQKLDIQKPIATQQLQHISLAEVVAPLRNPSQDELDEKESATAGWVAAQQLQLPTITLQPCETAEPAELMADGRSVSQVSSRSESPISERLPDARRSFSALFYDSKDQQLPFTDSDGLYDFPSSDGRRSAEPHPHHSAQHRHRSTSSGRHKRKATSASSRSPSSASKLPQRSPTPDQLQQHLQRLLPTASSHHLDVNKSTGALVTQQRRSPTKRRSMVATHRQRPPAEMSSSSSESIVPRRTTDRSTSDLLATHLLNATNPNASLLLGSHSADEQSAAVSGGSIAGGGSDQQLFPTTTAETAVLVAGRPNKALVRSNRRINRLRSFGNHLKFLRRFDVRSKSSADETAGTSRLSKDNDEEDYGDDDNDEDDDDDDEDGCNVARGGAINRRHSRSNDEDQERNDNDNEPNEDDEDDENDDEMSFVTSPLLFHTQPQSSGACGSSSNPSKNPPSHSTSSARSGNNCKTSSVGGGAKLRMTASEDRTGGDLEDTTAEDRAFVSPAKLPATSSGRRPWRSRNRRFVYDGSNINSD